ncbi:hypothetical protein Taro_037196 [Colocasia esculenta]|uniref:histidinol-phosphate transaminase n=1 Tax=Colocasia esculenta TaxID=4460 RepID=A0A843WAH8_COLES|nr:hypothetical protein [Colocasia esculenta]
MGVIGVSGALSPVLARTRLTFRGRDKGYRPCMASSSAAAAAEEQQQQVDGRASGVTGDSFIRHHLRNLSPYQPILPFEVLSARLGRKPEDIIKLDANENPYGPPPEASLAFSIFHDAHKT